MPPNETPAYHLVGPSRSVFFTLHPQLPYSSTSKSRPWPAQFASNLGAGRTRRGATRVEISGTSRISNVHQKKDIFLGWHPRTKYTGAYWSPQNKYSIQHLVQSYPSKLDTAAATLMLWISSICLGQWLITWSRRRGLSTFKNGGTPCWCSHNLL